MDSNITTTTPTAQQTVSRGQLEALKGGIRAAATSNPAGMADKGQRCAQITKAVCEAIGADSLPSLFATEFPKAMKLISDMAVPQRRKGPAEASLRTAKDGLADALASILQAKRGIAAFRHEVEGALLAPLKDALDVEGKGTLEAVVQDSVGYMLAMPMLQMEHDLDRMHEWLAVLATRLPAIGRALDGRKPLSVMLSAD